MIYYLWDFILFSFLGWCVDEIYFVVTEKKFVNKGFLASPFSPMYGLTVVLVDFVFSGLSQYPFIIFLGSAFLTTAIKFIFGYFGEKIFHFKWWDYSKLPLNINGYVCLPLSILWGLACLLLVELVLPLIDIFIMVMPYYVALFVPLGVSIFILIDTIGTIVTIIKLQKHLKKMENVSHLIEIGSTEKTDKELKDEYNRLLIKHSIFRKRLVKAFPDMQSQTYSEQLNKVKLRLNTMKENNLDEYEHIYENEAEKPFAFGLNFNKLFWLFVIGSAFGTVLETFWALATLKHFEFRVGLVYGPFIPVYGGGAVLITLCLYKLYKASDVIIYIASAIIGAGFEFFCSYFQEMFFGTVSWDYSDTPFNLDGRTNLMFALIWGLLGLVWVRYLYPSCARLIEKIPKKTGNLITIFLLVFMIFDVFMTCAGLARAEERADNIPPQNVFAEYLDDHLDDDYLSMVFPHMTNVNTGINVGTESTPDEQ